MSDHPQISEASMEYIVTEATNVAFANKDGGILGSWSIRKAVEHALNMALEEGIVELPITGLSPEEQEMLRNIRRSTEIGRLHDEIEEESSKT